VVRTTILARRLLPGIGLAMAIAACGSPPEPLPTGPPEAPASTAPASAAPSVSAYPSDPALSQPFPGGSLPAVGYPRHGTVPTYPVPTPPTAAVTPTPPPPSPAPRCTSGPTATQVLAAVRGKPGIPTGEQLRVWDGPFCAKTWQFTTMGVGEKGNDKVDPLLVVTTGKPSALTVVEAGADVCSDRVQRAAPPGIRVLACGS
jgi:hypothetical protein